MARVNFVYIKEHMNEFGESVLALDNFETELDDALKEIDEANKDNEKYNKEVEDDFQALLDKIISEYEELKEKKETEFEKLMSECLNNMEFKYKK